MDTILEFLSNLKNLTRVQPDAAFVHADLTVMIFTMIASLLISTALRPKPAQPKPAAFSDFDFPQSTEGTPQCVIFGDVLIDDWMVLGVGNYRTTPIIK